MQTRLINPIRDTALDCGILSYLPLGLSQEIACLGVGRIEEIRLRCGGICSITEGNRNLLLKNRLDRRQMDETVRKICDGSLYAYSDTINRGYIVMSGGIRVGVCGRAVTDKGRICGVYDISSLCIRLPHRAPTVGGRICELLRQTELCGGVLIYSPPGVGKTSLLRAVISSLAGGDHPIRTAVIDSRGELGCFLSDKLCVDLLSGYPKGQGIEIASRTLSPQLIVCDEIGGDIAEAEAIAAAHNCGVALLASAHARSTSELLCKKGIALLHGMGVFSYYVGISRSSGYDYIYKIDSADGS